MVKRIIFHLFFIITSAVCQAQQDISFYSDVSPRSGNINDTFLLSVVIENANRNVTPYLVGGDDFEVQLLGPRQSTSIVNGVVSTELAYNYQLTAKKDGVLESPAAEVEINGKKYTTSPIKVKVSKSENIKNSDSADSGIILKQSIDKPKVYLGEQVEYTLSLYTGVPIYDYSFSDEPLDGFWGQNMGDVDKSISTLEDRRYNLFRWSKALYPVRTGTISIPERNLTAQIQIKSKSRSFPFGYNDPYSDPFNSIFGVGKIEKREFKSNILNIEVLPLPVKPSNFENWGLSNVLVGATSIQIIGDTSSVKTGESKTLSVVIQSKGNLNAYNKLPLNEEEDFRIYQDNALEKNQIDGGSLTMKKTIKISIVPLKPGKFTLPAFRLGYFDTDSATYKEASTKVMEFDVSGPDLRTIQTEGTVEEKPINNEVPQNTQPEVVYVEDSFFKKLSNEISPSLALFITTSLLFLAYFSTLVLRFVKNKGSKKSAIKQLLQANDAATVTELARTALVKKLEIPAESAYGDQLRAFLSKKIPDQEIRFRLQAALDRLDAAQFSKDKNSQAKIEDIKQELSDILPRL